MLDMTTWPTVQINHRSESLMCRALPTKLGMCVSPMVSLYLFLLYQGQDYMTSLTLACFRLTLSDTKVCEESTWAHVWIRRCISTGFCTLHRYVNSVGHMCKPDSTCLYVFPMYLLVYLAITCVLWSPDTPAALLAIDAHVTSERYVNGQ